MTRLVRRIPPLPASGIDLTEEKEETEEKDVAEEEEMRDGCNEFPSLRMSSSLHVKVN